MQFKPSMRVLVRAEKKKYVSDKSLGMWRNQSISAGILCKKRFTGKKYFGTIFIKARKIDRGESYRIVEGVYSGDLLREAVEILKPEGNRVKLYGYFTIKRRNQNHGQLLLLGTEEATIAIAPRVDDDFKMPKNEGISIGRAGKPSRKLQRWLLFGEV